MKPSAPRYADDELVCSSMKVESGTAGPGLAEVNKSMVFNWGAVKMTSLMRHQSMFPPQVKLGT